MAQQLERGELGIDDIRDLEDHYPSYNVAPTTFQPVYRRDRSTHDHAEAVEPVSAAQDAPVADQASASAAEADQAPKHVLQGMKWGLIPFWTKRPPESGSQLKTINCRDDSLLENRGMWNSMKGRKRCIIPVQGYYEWLKKGPKEKIPHFTRRKDGQLLLLGGLYDSVQYEGSNERIWTFTIITTAAHSSLSWLHDRMPLIFDQGSKDLNRWLDDDAWTQDLVRMLHPYEGDLECYPVKKDVGKVGNNSPDFIIPIDSAENKSNIANFFNKQTASPAKAEQEADAVIKQEMTDTTDDAKDNKQIENNAPMPIVHPTHPKTSNVKMIPEEDLPFRFIQSHLETRPLETIEVYAITIAAQESAKIMQAVQKLRHKEPDLAHIKRIRKLDQSKRVKIEDGNCGQAMMEVVLCACEAHDEDTVNAALHDQGVDAELCRILVSKWPALTQKQYEEWSQLWPLNWRVPSERRVEMSESDYEECKPIMSSLFEHYETGDLPVIAIAYDPKSKQVLARTQDHRTTTGHPLKHAIIELCSSVAALEVVKRIENPSSPIQYLMSDLWIFITHEPCTMCTMALLHSRAARVFYAKSMPRTGGMESNYGIHWRQELNHRFACFGGWMDADATLLDDNTYV